MLDDGELGFGDELEEDDELDELEDDAEEAEDEEGETAPSTSTKPKKDLIKDRLGGTEAWDAEKNKLNKAQESSSSSSSSKATSSSRWRRTGWRVAFASFHRKSERVSFADDIELFAVRTSPYDRTSD